MPDRRWNLADFDAVLTAPTVSDEDLSRMLPGRRAAEISKLRAAIHAWHTPPFNEGPIQSDAIARHLSRNLRPYVCAVCGSQF
jgi:hypothetical protein